MDAVRADQHELITARQTDAGGPVGAAGRRIACGTHPVPDVGALTGSIRKS
jgi:hypothetical protein